MTPYRGRLDQILRSWEHTPYMAGQQAKGVGVDCVGFVCGVLDELNRRPATPFETLPPDASLHDREGAIRAILAIRRRFAPNHMVKDGSLEPGDVVLVGPGGGHALMVGCQPHTFWHASNLAGRVVRSGSSYLTKNPIAYVIRQEGRESWI